MANWNENADLIQGQKLNLYLTSGKTVVAYGTNASLQIDSEQLDVSSKFSCKWASALGGKASYTINSDSLYSSSEDGISFDTFVEMMVRGDQVEWYLGEEQAWSGTCATNPHTLDTTKTYFNGRGIITSTSIEAGLDEAVSCSITIAGAGPVEKNGETIG